MIEGEVVEVEVDRPAAGATAKMVRGREGRVCLGGEWGWGWGWMGGFCFCGCGWVGGWAGGRVGFVSVGGVGGGWADGLFLWVYVGGKGWEAGLAGGRAGRWGLAVLGLGLELRWGMLCFMLCFSCGL